MIKLLIRYLISRPDTYSIKNSSKTDDAADEDVPPVMSVVCDPREGADGGVGDAEQLQHRDHEDGTVGPVEGTALEVPLEMKLNG